MSSPSKDNAPASAKTGFRWKGAVYLLLAVGLFAAIRFLHVQELLKPILDWIGKLGAWRPILFIGIYIIAAVLFVPGSILTLGAGALFGLVIGSVCVSVGATLGATAAFLISRYLARGAVAKKIAGNEKFAAINSAVANEGWKIVFLTRLSRSFLSRSSTTPLA